MKMKNKKEVPLPAQGTSDPQGLASVGGSVPVPPPLSLDNRQSPGSRVGPGADLTATTPHKEERLIMDFTKVVKRLRWILGDRIEGALEWHQHLSKYRENAGEGTTFPVAQKASKTNLFGLRMKPSAAGRRMPLYEDWRSS